jgi:hypothetical protein
MRKYKKPWHGLVVWGIIIAFFLAAFLYGYFIGNVFYGGK